MKFKAILFDFDGLMFDTEKVWKEYFFKANDVFNVNFTEQDRTEIIGRNEQMLRAVLKSKKPNLDVDTYRDWTREQAHHHILTQKIDEKKGLINLLEYIKKENLLTAIVSGSERKIINSIIEKSAVKNFDFSSFVTGDRKVNPKPNPDVYLKACEELNVKPEEAIVLEDAYLGVKAGKSAGCFTIMIPDTVAPNDEMKQTADLILNDLNEVVDFLKR